MVKKSEFQDELKKFESILESLEEYPDFKKLFLPKDLEAMRKALENQTSISGDSLSRIKVALVRFNAEINKTHKNNKNQKLVTQATISQITTSLLKSCKRILQIKMCKLKNWKMILKN